MDDTQKLVALLEMWETNVNDLCFSELMDLATLLFYSGDNDKAKEVLKHSIKYTGYMGI